MKNKMAKPLGLLPASKHRAQSIRICVPLELQASYGGRKDFRISLGKLHGTAAKVRATKLRAEKDAEFAARGAALAAPSLSAVAVVTPELSEAIARGVYAAGMSQDDALRESSSGAALLREVAASIGPNTLLIPTGTPTGAAPADEGLTDLEASTLEGLNAAADGAASIDLARRRNSAAIPAADRVARAMGLDVDWTTETGKQALKASLGEQRRAWKDRTRRDQGEAIPTPEQASPQTAPTVNTSHTLWDVMGAWEATNLPSRTHISKTKSAIRLIDECLGPMPLKAYTKAQGATVIAYMREKCKAQKTAKDFFDNAKALLNYAADRQDWLLSGNPWKAHSVIVKKSRKRQDIPADVLFSLFDSPLFRSYTLPQSTQAGADAAYWVPLLGLYTGARQSELCQLRIEDITTIPGMGISLSILADLGDDEEGSAETTTKGETARRRVPIHRELLELGFEDYLADMKDAGNTLLFPSVKYPKGQPSGTSFTVWFSAYRKSQGVTKRYQDFHAFRHTSRTRLTDASVEGMISSTLMGHIDPRSTGRDTYDHSIGSLRGNLEKLSYADLKLTRCYPTRQP